MALVIFHRVVCLDSSISAADSEMLNKLTEKASSILGCPLDRVQVVRGLSDGKVVILVGEGVPPYLQYTNNTSQLLW